MKELFWIEFLKRLYNPHFDNFNNSNTFKIFPIPVCQRSRWLYPTLFSNFIEVRFELFKNIEVMVESPGTMIFLEFYSAEAE